MMNNNTVNNGEKHDKNVNYFSVLIFIFVRAIHLNVTLFNINKQRFGADILILDSKF